MFQCNYYEIKENFIFCLEILFLVFLKIIIEIIYSRPSKGDVNFRRRSSQNQIGKASVKQKPSLAKKAGLDMSMLRDDLTSSGDELSESSHQRTLQKPGASKQTKQIQVRSFDQNVNDDENDNDEQDDDDDFDDNYDIDNPPPEWRPYVCPVCERRYDQKPFLTVHMNIHNYEKQFKCDICMESFWLNCELIQHKRSQHNGKVASPGISASSHSTKLNEQAEQSGSSTRERKVRDSELNEEGDGKDNSRHVESNSASRKSSQKTRRASKTYSCPECYREFNHKGHLNRHLRIHSGEKPFKCKTCDKDFSDKSALTKHLRIHSGDKPYECRFCDKAFSQSGSLTTHLRIHNGEKPFECRFCIKSFSQSSHLTTHLRLHTGEKPFVCETCPSRFTQKFDLVRHLLIHAGEKPFTCDICKQKFRHKITIRKHMNIHIHNGKRIHRCKVCKKVFHQRHILSEHHRKEHGKVK